MERTVLMVRPEQRAKLAKLAKQAQVSTAEINRRAIDAYEPEAPNRQELEQLAEIVIRSSIQATQILTEARKAVNETLVYFAKKRAQ